MLTSTAPSPAARRMALGSAGFVLAWLALWAPYGRAPLPAFPAALAASQMAIVILDLITAVMLWSHYGISRNRAIQPLAAAYVFSALMAVAYALSVPGLVMPGGLPGASGPASAWLDFAWHAGFPVFLIGYATRRDLGQPAAQRSHAVVNASSLGAVGLAAVLVALSGWGAGLMSTLGMGARTWMALVAGLVAGLAAVKVWRRGRSSVLDLWIVAALLAWVADSALASVLSQGPYELGWYMGRLCGLLAQAVVLAALLRESYSLSARLARASRELEQSNAELAESSRMKSQFLANMSHEIRTPMNAIIGFSNLLARTPLDDRQRDFVHKVGLSGKHLLGVINDILDFSKVEAGVLVFEHEEFALEPMLTGTVDLIIERADAKGLEVILHWDPDVPTHLVGDALRLRQILLNYLNNAIKFTSRGEVVIHVGVADRSEGAVLLRFEVQDTGIGLSEEQVAVLFQSFRQADVSTTRRFGGTGLGLAISKALAQMMGGEVGVASAPGQGSTFWFTVRLAIGRAPARMPAPGLAAAARRVLVVDDNAQARAALSRMLAGMGMEPVATGDAAAALQELRHASLAGRPYEGVFLDWRMPDMDGMEMTRRLRGLGLANVPVVIMVTVSDRDEAMAEAAGAGLQNMLVKPINPSQLFDVAMLAFNAPQEATATSGLAPLTVREGLEGVRGARILLVEDNEINQQVARAILEDFGVMVDVAEDGELAVRKLDTGTYDLVLMDVHMPNVDGIVATQRIRESTRFGDLPIVAMTASAMEQDRRRCLNAGMSDFLSKPIDVKELWRVLVRYIQPRDASPSTFTPIATPSVAEAGDGLPWDVPDLDVTLGLSRTLGKKEIYLAMLGHFVRGNRDLATRLRLALAGGDFKGAHLLAHTVKAVAGTIGALKLQDAAQQLELVLSTPDELDHDLVNASLEAFVGALSPMLAQLEKHVEGARV